MMFRLLTVFPNNAAEQEWYYITKMLKKPHCISMHQFVQRVEQLNFYIACFAGSTAQALSPVQFPRTCCSPRLIWRVTIFGCAHIHGRISTIFTTKVWYLWTYVFCSCLLRLLSAYVSKTISYAQSTKKASNKVEKGNKRDGTKSMARVPKKACTKNYCNLCKKHGGAYTMHNMKDRCRYGKDGSEKIDFCAAKQGRKNTILQSYLLCNWARNRMSSRWQARNRMPTERNIAVGIVIPTQNRELGPVA